MRKLLFLLGIGFVCLSANSQNFAIKSNVLYDATTTLNLGVEFGLADQWTLDVSGNYNPWSFARTDKNSAGVMREYNAKLKHWVIQPEVRWWTCEKFNGHFFGLHAHYGQFNVGGLTFLPNSWANGWKDKDGVHHEDGLQNKRFEGWGAGTGLAYGYHWILSNRFSFEFSLGGGYAYLEYDKYPLESCGEKESQKYMHYFGLTKLGVTAVFMLK